MKEIPVPRPEEVVRLVEGVVARVAGRVRHASTSQSTESQKAAQNSAESNQLVRR